MQVLGTNYFGSADSGLLEAENILVVVILVCWNWKLFLQCTDSDLVEIIMAEFWDKIVFSSKRI